MNQFIKQVTVTGADDSIPPESLQCIHENYPFVEFGILCSKTSSGHPRFPSQDWLTKLRAFKTYPMQLSMHLCGAWVRSLGLGSSEILKDWIADYFTMFNRVQLNFHNIAHRAGDKFLTIIKETFNTPIIFQLDGMNDNLYRWAKHNGVDAYPLYDLSGGAGILPTKWDTPIGDYCGYAGGLSPDNLKGQLDRIAGIVENTTIWIDAETHLRSHDDKVFDTDKVIRFLEIARPYVVNQKG